MPAYGSQNLLLLYEGKQIEVFANEPVVNGESSIAVELRRTRGASYPFGVSYELVFSGAPGTFQVDIQHADNDVDARYCTVASISVVNGSNAARFELPTCWTKFARLNIVALGNPVNLTAIITR